MGTVDGPLANPNGGSLAHPYGSVLQAKPSGNPADILGLLPSNTALMGRSATVYVREL